MDHVRLPKRKRSSLSAEQKAAFVLLMFLGLGGVILGFKSFGSNLSRPFDLQLAKAVANSNGEFLLTSEREAQELEAQKTRDTDQDGLNDYDELYVFKTSPYLADSDSDGFTDQQEVFSGNDPNCPQGKQCRSYVTSADATLNLSADPVDLVGEEIVDAATSPDAAAAAQLPFSNDEEIAAYFASLSPEEVRAALIEYGIPQEELDQIDDETLQALFAETINSALAEGLFAEVLGTAPTTP